MTMPSIHMTPHEWNQVAAILHQLLPNREIFAFVDLATVNPPSAHASSPT